MKILLIGAMVDYSCNLEGEVTSYHAVSVTVDGVTTTSGQHYGYGDQYRQTAFDMLQAQGYFKGYTYTTFCSWCYEEKNRSRIHFTCADVKRERDL